MTKKPEKSPDKFKPKIMWVRNRVSKKLERKQNRMLQAKSITKQLASVVKLCDLPSELLEKIIGNINIWHLNRVRATCKRLRNCCDSQLMHHFQKAISDYGRIDKRGYEYSALQVIQMATWAYIKAGYGASFLGSMLPMMRNTYRNPFCPSVGKIKLFLLKFYSLTQEHLGDPVSQISRLLYFLTFQGFLNSLDNSTCVSSIDIQPDHWRVVYQLRGSWLGMLWPPSVPQYFDYSTDRNEILALLAEIMIAVHSETAFKKVWECNKKIFVYGHDQSERKRAPTTTFTLNVHGSMEIIQFFKTNPIHKEWIRLPKDEFNVSLEIQCQEAVKWGCYPTYRMEIGPYYDKDDWMAN